MDASIQSAVRTVMGTTWIGDDSEDPNSYWAEGEPATIQIERTDEDEVRVGVMLRGDSVDSATLYISRSEATRLVLAVAAAIGDS